MNIITIDPSLTCTAMCINGRFFVYAMDHVARTKTGKYTKWFNIMEQYTDYRIFDPIDNSLPYSQSEVAKLLLYDKISDTIVSDIALNLIEDDPDVIICIEGYSYSSVSSALIDLVTFSTLIRSKLFIDFEFHPMVISPSTLKVRSCEFTYGKRFDKKGKQISCRNCNEVSGGRFKKPDMMNALVDNEDLASDWYVNVLRTECSDLVGVKNIPKPVEDMNDAKLMYEVILSIASDAEYDIVAVESSLLE